MAFDQKRFVLSKVGTARRGFPALGIISEEIHNLDGSFLIIHGVVGAEGGTTCFRERNGSTGGHEAFSAHSFDSRFEEFIGNGLLRS